MKKSNKRKIAPLAEETPQAKENIEDAWQRKREHLRKMLGSTYSVQKATQGKNCAICGEQRLQLYQMDNGLVMCQQCRQSEISTMQEAAGLLYTTYGNFKRLFCDVTFRYPDLEISEQSMHKINNIQHGDENASDLVQILDSRDTWLSLRIVRDIPRCFLEELYVQTFAKLLKGRNEIRLVNGSTLSWAEAVQYYLTQSGREQQAKLFPVPENRNTAPVEKEMMEKQPKSPIQSEQGLGSTD